MEFDCLIVGAGHGGAQTAIQLRQLGFAGSIGVIGDEPELPYERPPLSKEFLAGEKDFSRLLIRTEAFWAERQVTFLTGRRVTAVDPEASAVTTATGEEFGYGELVWAAGGSPRRLRCEGHDLAGVHAVRTRADVEQLKTELATTYRIIVVGGGYIGLEAAAVLIKLGKAVTIVETMERVLARVAGAELSAFLEGAHRARGVTIVTGATVAAITGADGRAAGVTLADGRTLPADMVIVGIGILPETAPLTSAGAAGNNGVDVDDHCRTSLPHVWAIGDCAAHENAFAGGARLRLESVQNANDMATTVARALTGNPRPYRQVPWFWSNQFDLRLQTVGLSIGHDATVLRGDRASGAFAIVYLRQGRVIALDCVNAVKDYVQGKALVEQGIVVAAADLADTEIPLKHWHGQGAAA
jgi:3-phenylpropionate/trans-cinnamate dioxygenase ferredoxin reductase component